MPNRIVRDGILYSEPISRLSPEAELLFRKLISVADDFGRYYASPPSLIISGCYPLQVETIRSEDIEKWLKELTKEKIIHVYRTEGKSTLEIIKFRQRQRSNTSKFPENPKKCNTIVSQVTVKRQSSDSHMSPEYEYEYEDEVEVESGKLRLLGKDWQPTKEHSQYALQEKVDLKKAALIFRNWAAGKKRANWNLCFTNALLNDNWMKRVAPDKQCRAADGTTIERIQIK
jgi:hypothetical protein